MGQKKLLLFKPNMIHEVRKAFNLEGPGRMEAAVDLLEEWTQKQRHFTKHDIPRHYLETTLITCKGSMERSKAMLDKICTMRTLVPEFFGEYDVKRDFPGLRDYFVTVLLPKPTADLCRVYVCKIYDNGSMKKHAMNALRYLTILADYVKLNDYLGKAIVIVDLMDANLSDLIGGIDVVDIKRHSSIIMDGFGMRPQKVYVLTASKLVCTLMTLMKSAVKQKVASRMEVVKSCEELHKHLPREILPMDYGGKEESIRDIQDLWLDALSEQEFLEYLREMNTAKTNEALRLRADFNQNYAGMPGTFKYLHID